MSKIIYDENGDIVEHGDDSTSIHDTDKTGRVVHIKIKDCTECKWCEILSDPDHTDSFNYDDVKIVCKLANREIAGALRPYEVKRFSDIPEFCPLL